MRVDGNAAVLYKLKTGEIMVYSGSFSPCGEGLVRNI